MPSPTVEALPPYRRPAAEVVAGLGSDARRGLPATEARARLDRDGPNLLPSVPPTPGWRRFLAQLRDVLTILLLVATAVSFAAWWIEREEPIPYEALTILAIVLLNAALGYVQERRAEQAIAALEAMTAPSARVARDGERRMVPTAELVPGDVLLLEEGDTFPADARVLEAIALQGRRVGPDRREHPGHQAERGARRGARDRPTRPTWSSAARPSRRAAAGRW